MFAMHTVNVRFTGLASTRSPTAGFNNRVRSSGLDVGITTTGERKQILLVEDDGDNADMMAELLEDAGFVVVVASGAAFGLAALRTRQFALVLSDYRMPGQTGVDMLLAARAEGLLDGVAALIVSAYELTDLPWRALRKPFVFTELLAEVRRAIGGSAAVRPAMAR
jgi:CheY-like chemotaxis protein